MKCVLLVAAVLLLASECEAQRVWYGVTIGGDAGSETDGVRSFEYGDAAYYQQHKIGPGDSKFLEFGLAGGFEFDYALSNALALSGNALYDQKGVVLRYIYTTESSPLPIATTSQWIKLNYLEVPVLLKWRPFAEGLGPFLFAGPSVGFLLSGSSELSLHVENEPSNSYTLAQKNSPSVSAVSGIGVAFDLVPSLRCEATASYAWGLTNDSFRALPPEQFTFGGPDFPDPAYTAAARDFRLMATVLFLFPG